MGPAPLTPPGDRDYSTEEAAALAEGEGRGMAGESGADKGVRRQAAPRQCCVVS